VIDHEARIALVLSKFRIVLNKGSNDGVQINDKFLVYGIGIDIIDPDNGESLGALEIVRGRGKVVHVQERACTVESLERRLLPVSKRVRTPSGIIAQLNASYSKEVIESEPDIEDLPFDEPAVGDFCRPI
jgi:hypothetical protein